MRHFVRYTAIIAAILPGAASAHTGHDAVFSLTSGFLHPVAGLDHLLAMLAVGLFAAQLGGRAIWLLPLSFMTLLAGGAAFGMAGFALPFTEAGIAISVVTLGLAVALALRTPIAAASLMTAGFAVFHGFAHGAELPQGAGAASYAAGFVAASAVLHGIGLGIGVAANRFGPRAQTALRISSGAVAAAGIALLFAAA